MIAELFPKGCRVFDIIGKTAVLAALVMFILPPHAADAFDVLLGTGKDGTFNHFVGKALCRAVNRHAADMRCTAVPMEDETDSITNLQSGSLDICLIDSRTIFDALNRKGRFAYLDIQYDNLLNLQRVYDVPVTLAVRGDAGIHDLNALKGKRVNAGAPASAPHVIFDTILKTKGWSQKDFGLVEKLPQSHSQAQMAFCHGTIQAMLHIGVHPDAALGQLSALCNAGLVGLYDDDILSMVQRNPAYTMVEIAAGTYPFQAKPIFTIATGMMLVSSRELDEASVYQIMDAIQRGRKQIQNAHPALSEVSKTGGYGNKIGLERHPGAVKYFSEQ